MGALEVEPNLKEATRWYKHAIQQGSVEAAHELQRLYKHIEKLEKQSRKSAVTQLHKQKPSSSPAKAGDPVRRDESD
jgi:TPR repeat protein